MGSGGDERWVTDDEGFWNWDAEVVEHLHGSDFVLCSKDADVAVDDVEAGELELFDDGGVHAWF